MALFRVLRSKIFSPRLFSTMASKQPNLISETSELSRINRMAMLPSFAQACNEIDKVIIDSTLYEY